MNLLNMNKDIDEIINFLRKVWDKEDFPLKRYKEYKGNTPFQILISTILSLRTKDEITYPTAYKLFQIAGKPEDFLRLSLEEIEKLIYPVGFYRNKAKVIKEISRIIIENYNGCVPDNINELLKLPGVGRKTANLVLSVAFGKDVICVDTHVHRISNRIGLVKTKTPEETEFALMEVFPKKYWKEINHLMVGFGQTICKPQKPSCNVCEIKYQCNYFEKSSGLHKK